MKAGYKCKRAIAWDKDNKPIMWSDDTYTVDSVDDICIDLIDSDGNIYCSIDKNIKPI